MPTHKDGAETDVAIRMLKEQKEHYGSLAATYQQKGMKREAEVFSQIVEEFATLQQAMLKSKSEGPQRK